MGSPPRWGLEGGRGINTLARMSSESVPWAGRPVAIVHDWFQGYHGAERVVEVLADDVLAEAARVDVFTFHAARELLPPRLADRIVGESRLAGLPGIRQVGHDPGRWRYLLPYMPRYFRSLDLSGYAAVARLLALLRDQRRAAGRHADPLLLPHADALRLAHRHRARAPGRRPRQGPAGALGLAAAPGPRRRPAPGRGWSPTRPRCGRGSSASTAARPTSSTRRSRSRSCGRRPARRRAAALPLGRPARPLQAAAPGRRGLPRPARTS